MPMDINALQQLIAGQQGGAGGPAPGGGPPGAMPPGAAPPGAEGQPPGGQPGAQEFDPREGVAKAMLLLTISMHRMGLTETAQKVTDMVTAAVERLNKRSPKGMQGAAQGAAAQGPQFPATGQMPGANVY